MKTTHRNPLLRNFILAATIYLTLGQAAKAAALTWTGGSNNWKDTVQGGWNAVWSNANPDTGTFSNVAGGTVSVLGDIVTGLGTNSTTGGGIHFAAGNYTLQSDSASLVRTIKIGATAATGYVSMSSGVTTTIGNRVTLTKGLTNGDLRIRGGGTLTIGSGTVGGAATLSNTNGTNISTIEDGGKLVVTTGGTATFSTSFVVGSLAAGASMVVTNANPLDPGGTITIAGASSNLVLGNGGVTSNVSLKMTAGSLSFTNPANNTNNGAIRIGGTASSNTTGVIDLDGGTLAVNRIYEGASGTTTSTVNLNGGTIRALYIDTTDFLVVDTVNVKANGVMIDTNGRYIGITMALQTDLISTGGGLTKTGQGVLSLSGANTYTGGTSINQGVLAYLNKASVSATGTVSIASGAGVALGIKAGDSAYYETTDVDTLLTSGILGNISVNTYGLVGIDTTQGAVSYTYTGVSTRGLAKSGAGTLTLTGSNTYSGATAIYGGSLAITSASNLGDNSATNSIILGSGTLSSASGSYTLGTNRAISLVGSGSILVDADTLTIDGAVSGSGSLTKSGTGTLLISGATNHTGTTTVAAGTLGNGSATSFTGTSALSITTGATFDLSGFDASLASIANTTGAIVNSAAGSDTNTLTITAQAADGTDVLITDNGTRQIKLSFTSNGLAAYGATTNANNTYSGGLILGNAMRASVVSNATGTPGAITSGPFGTGAITINGGGTNANGAQVFFNTTNRTLTNHVIVNGNAGNGSRSGSFRIGATGVAITGNITANLADAYFGSDAAAGAELTLNGQLTGPKGFRFYQSNNSNTNAWTTILNNLTANPNDYGGSTTINNTQTTVKLGAANQIPNGPGKGNVFVNFGTLDLNGASETINGLSGGATAIIDNVATGTTNTLTIGDGDATGLIFSGVIKDTTGTLALTKIGSGTQTLSGANDYSGATTISDGTLHLTGSLAAQSAVTVGGDTATGNPTLTGAGGTVNGTLNIAAAGGGAAGTINPGTIGTTGTLNAGATTISGTYACDITAAACDLLAVNGTLTLTGATLDITTDAPAAASYTIATYTGAAPAFTTVNGLPLGYSLDYATAGVIKLAKRGYASWASDNSVLEGENGDDDDDGIINLVEYALGLDPQASSLPAGTFIGNTLTFTKGAEAKAAGDVTYAIETSSSLAAGTWTTVAATQDADTISYTLPAGQGKIFARLKVIK